MAGENIVDSVRLNLDEGDYVTDVVVVAVTQRMDSYGQAIYVASSAHTGYITQIGALEAALEEVRMPYYSDDGED